jgi:hypothetical protein
MKYLILYWKTKELRDIGFADVMIDTFYDIEKAKEYGKKLVDKHNYETIEVIEEETEKVVYGYDGIDIWYNNNATKDK